MEHNAYNTTLGGWYNAPLFDYTKGRTTAALKVIAGCASCNGGVGGIFADRPTAPGTTCQVGAFPVCRAAPACISRVERCVRLRSNS